MVKYIFFLIFVVPKEIDRENNFPMSLDFPHLANGKAAVLEDTVKASQLEIIELQHHVEALR